MKLQDLRNADFRHFSNQMSKKVNRASITVITSYITVYTFKVLDEKPCGAYKVRTVTERNYSPKQVCTEYYNAQGDLISLQEYRKIPTAKYRVFVGRESSDPMIFEGLQSLRKFLRKALREWNEGTVIYDGGGHMEIADLGRGYRKLPWLMDRAGEKGIRIYPSW